MDEYDDLLLTSINKNDLSSFRICLSSLCEPKIYLNRIYNHTNNQKCTLLMIACLNGYEEFIYMLLNYFQPNLEILNEIQINNRDKKLETYRDVSVLWAAVALNNFRIVKQLVEHGAKINHRTSTNSTPVRCACYSGNVDMVHYLIQNGADIHIKKQNTETNLSLSVYCKNLEVTFYLVNELGCDVNECDDDGRSPLYFAVKSQSFEIVQFLLNRGAKNSMPKCDRMSPLMLAADKRLKNFVNEISLFCSSIEQIEAKELLGSSFSSAEHGLCDLQQSYEYYQQALELRMNYNLPKILRQLNTNDVFNNRQECQTIEQLNELRKSSDDMHIEALLIRERLLGANSDEYRYSVIYRGAILADNERYKEAVPLWMYELDLIQRYSIPIDPDDIRQFVALFCDMLNKSSPIPIDALLIVIKIVIEEIKRNTEYIDLHLYTLLFLVTITSQSSIITSMSINDRRIFYRLIHSINQNLYVTRVCESSLLHLCLNESTSSSHRFIDEICKYPCYNTVQTLLQCGADVNISDAIGNTPLHIFVSNVNFYNENIFQLLCNTGAHLDYTNALGETPVNMISRIDLKQLVQTKTKIKLKCICARFIRQNHIQYQEQISRPLVNFVQRH